METTKYTTMASTNFSNRLDSIEPCVSVVAEESFLCNFDFWLRRNSRSGASSFGPM